MIKKMLFILFLVIGIVAIIIVSYCFSATANIAEYVALYTSISTACYAILAEPKERTEPYLRTTAVLKRYGQIMIGNYDSPSHLGLNIWIENVGYSNAKGIEVRCQLVPDGSIPLKDNGIFKHSLLTPRKRIQYQAVESVESNKLLSQQLVIEATFSNEDDKEQKPIKNKYLVKELEEDLREVKT
jgi:hypothetical protein